MNITKRQKQILKKCNLFIEAFAFLLIFSCSDKLKIDNCDETCSISINKQGILKLENTKSNSLRWLRVRKDKLQTVHLPDLSMIPLSSKRNKTIAKSASLEGLTMTLLKNDKVMHSKDLPESVQSIDDACLTETGIWMILLDIKKNGKKRYLLSYSTIDFKEWTHYLLAEESKYWFFESMVSAFPFEQPYAIQCREGELYLTTLLRYKGNTRVCSYFFDVNKILLKPATSFFPIENGKLNTVFNPDKNTLYIQQGNKVIIQKGNMHHQTLEVKPDSILFKSTEGSDLIYMLNKRDITAEKFKPIKKLKTIEKTLDNNM